MCSREKEFTIRGTENCLARGYDRTGFFEVDTSEQRSWTVQLTDSAAIAACVDQVLEENREQVQKYLTGNEKIFGYFVGETMKRTQGKANPKVVNDLLRQKLRSMRV